MNKDELAQAIAILRSRGMLKYHFTIRESDGSARLVQTRMLNDEQLADYILCPEQEKRFIEANQARRDRVMARARAAK